ncbi:uncharacterized protein SPSK_04941 [Sporothrix schenckii 1099-18]|uniref:F-box domain-containing protein n=2 Tax=Sporothrix schenckii TaxID=29908 RepID=U7Q339_SPOS1|nr:uncharacterized protein SPSK_04941 [Sporothrix schenckii 1099-18]ERT02278.1 hypothetical protein HMPREF1624_00576 [Sporothrix schenckii ATCC 58251]KJR80482.1 hypothetical protein SPSK_04941 [Sporothrix schenckii 1099-18]
MDAFLAAALAPKTRPKRKSTPSIQARNDSNESDNDGRGSGSRTGSTNDAKRPRPRGFSLATETKAETKAKVTTEMTTRTRTTTEEATGRTKATASLDGTQKPTMLSFQDTISSLNTSSSGPTRTRLILDKAITLQDKGRLDDAYSLLTRALIACVCHAQLRSQFKDAGVPLDAIDPVGQCSCRDFVAMAQTRRPQTMSLGFGAPTPAEGENMPFPISELDLAAVYNLATRNPVCTCGSGRLHCTEPDHLAALDRLAAVASKLGRHEDVSRIGQWYMDLAPQHAEGYLHVAKAVLALTAAKKKDGRLKDDVRRERKQARFTARCLYTHGLHNVRAYGDAASDLAQVLARCCRQYSHDDYLPDLPVETVEAIFRHLSLSDILACRRVSRRWALVLKRVRLRPAQVRFHGWSEAPVKGLQSLLRQMPDLRTDHLSINFASSRDPLRTARFVTLALNHFKDTESLELWTWPYDEFVSTFDSIAPTALVTVTDEKIAIEARLGPAPLPPLPTVSRCRKLTLHTVKYSKDLAVARCLVPWASQSLESIELNGVFVGGPFAFRLPRLRHVKLLTSEWGADKLGFEFTTSVCEASACLQQLYLDDITFYVHRNIPTAAEDKLLGRLTEAFQHLHTLVIGPRCQLDGSSLLSMGIASFVIFPPLPPGLRCLDIISDKEFLAERIMFGDRYDPNLTTIMTGGDVRPLQHLESFRCLSPVVNPVHMFQLIEPSLGVAGCLAHLELNVRDIDSNFMQDLPPCLRIPFPERIRTIGLYDFNCSSTSAGSDVLIRDRIFLDWVRQFRNVETISVYPAWRYAARANDGGEGGRFVVALVEQALRYAAADARTAAEAEDKNQKDIDMSQHLKLRTIYQGMLHGTWQQRATKLIAGHLLHIPPGHLDYRPPVFPWPDRTEEVADRDNDL